MIQANELRIGNLFNPIIDVKVEAWMLLPESKIVFEPIPLTEDWLVRFGFDKNEYKKEVWFSGNKLAIDFRNGQYFIRGYEINVKYIHQLQNLYFALTGTELELK
tara:strand:+ start:31209 stop:31523 length:315 start_codon:yes stop_codon:yes gene_type:complete